MACSNSLGSIWPDDLYITCGVGQLIEPGQSSSTFPTMAGWKIRVVRAGAFLDYQDQGGGDPYFDYTAITGEATWSVKPIAGEKFIIQAYKPA